MKRPMLLRLAPPDLRTRIFYHLYRSRRERYKDLYVSAPLYHAPQVRMALMATDEGHACIAFTGFYELELTRSLVDAALKGGCLVDVGANYGYYSLLWAAQRPENRVLAFEASPRNHRALADNVKRNGLDAQVDVRTVALGQSAGHLEFDLGPPEQCGWGGFTRGRSANTVQVRVMRLDEIWDRSDEISVLKIDVEGADFWVLRGAEGLLRKKRVRAIYFEQNKPRMKELGIDPSDVHAWLSQVGYAVAPMSSPAEDLVEFKAYPRHAS